LIETRSKTHEVKVVNFYAKHASKLEENETVTVETDKLKITLPSAF
jgi:hypothetical protein